jgi:hypothetical protein
MTVISLTVTLLMILTCILIVAGGRALQRNVPGGGQFQIDWNWQNGYRLLAIRQAAGYFSYQTEQRIRFALARPFFDKMDRLRAEDDLAGALQACSQAEQLIGHYGGNGTHFYECRHIQAELECSEGRCTDNCTWAGLENCPP